MTKHNHINHLITDNMDVWASAIKRKSSAGRGSSKKIELYGIKKLRELILELAVRGKLVEPASRKAENSLNDEPASVLLEHIAAEKAQLVKEGKIKKPKKLPEISEDEKPFELPEGWEWARLGEVGLGSTGKTPNTGKSEYFNSEGIPFIGPGQITEMGAITQADKYLTNSGAVLSTEALPNDILMVCIGGSIGKSSLVRERLTFNQQINCISPLLVKSKYLLFALQTRGFYQSLLDNSSGSATPIINRSKWEALLVPVASIEEQHRIVAKVDELMALCDQLEAQTESSLDAHQTLVTVLLDTLVNSQNAEELSENWTRISGHFDTLFTTEQSIDQLKQTILQLAVMGKLVEQVSREARNSPNYEPASVLLERIAAEKADLIKQGKIKKQKPLPPISEDEKPFELPKGWEIYRLEELINIIVDCPHSTAKFQDDGLLCLDTNSFKQGELLSHKFRYVSKETFDSRNKRLAPKAGDIVFAREGSVGESVVIPNEIRCCLGQRVMLFRPSNLLSSEFIRLSISNKSALDSLLALHKGIGAKHVNVGDMKLFAIGVPPSSEQHRIVAKVDELIAICDQLKARLSDAQTTQLNLADALVEQAL